MEIDAEKRLMQEFKLSQQQAKFCILVAGGMKPIDAVEQCYAFTNKTNAYGQLKDLVHNPKIDAALKALGMNLKDKFEKNACAIVEAFEEIAFNPKTSTRDRLTALRELAAYNPMLQTHKRRDADDMEETDIEKRLREHYGETESNT